MKEYLKNLPKSDDNEEIQQRSLNALKSILPTDKFLLRDERVDDKGVDASLEVKHEQSFTNFRSQIQLKGTSSIKQNKDESVSLSVSTSNLNYLLNNPISLYILYILPRNEFRFVWAKDELRKLSEVNPHWDEQENVTLRFTQILDESTIVQIHEQITREGGLFRKINETISANLEGVSNFEITHPNLELIDANKAKKILDFYGLELLNTGYENFVLQKYQLLVDSEKKKSKFLLIKSRAEGMLGKYRAALDTLGIIELTNYELSPIEKFHFESIENHCNWQLGLIHTEQFLAKLKELSTSDLAKDSILDRFNFLRFALMHEADFSEIPRKLTELKKVGDEISSDEQFSQEMKVNIKFGMLEMELKQVILAQELLIGRLAMFATTKTLLPRDFDEWENCTGALKNWLEKSNELLKEAGNITTKADISYLQVSLWFHTHRSHEFWLNTVGGKYHIDEKDSDEYIERLQNAINIYIYYQRHYPNIRAKMLMVEILSLTGKSEESETLRKQINSQANRMSYDALKNLISFSLHKNLSDYAQNTMS